MRLNVPKRLRSLAARRKAPCRLSSEANEIDIALPSYEESLRILTAVHPDHGRSCLRMPDEADVSSRSIHTPLPTHVTLDIIIPAYNVEAYVEECVDSVLSQKTACDFRAIIVEDGATDHTAEVLERYREMPGVYLVNQENRGLAGARNTGLALSNADYIMFLDSDDRLAPGAVETMVSTARRTGADVVAGGYYNFTTGKKLHLPRIHRVSRGQVHSINAMTGHSCFKIFRSTVFDGIIFPEGYLFEDSIMHQLILPRAQILWNIPNIIYERRIAPGSITQTQKGNPKSIDTVWVTLRLLEDRKQLGMKADTEFLEYMLTMAQLSQHRLAGHGREVQMAAFRIYQEILNTECRDLSIASSRKRKLENIIREGSFVQFLQYCGC